MIGKAEVAQLEREADEVGQEIRGVDSAVYEYCPVDVWMKDCGEC